MEEGIAVGTREFFKVKIKPSFVRMRKRWRAVLVVPSHLTDLAPHLRQKNFHPIVLPVAVLDQQQKELWLPGRTLVTDKPEELAFDDVHVLELSLIESLRSRQTRQRWRT
jgi:hypothetical protein